MLNVVAGGNETGQAIVTHDDVDMVSLTGSVETGKWIARAAADTLKRVHLELGGKAPVVVFDDADMEAVDETIAGTGYYNAGQDCTAATRVLAGSKVYDDVLSGPRRPGRAATRPATRMDPETTLGPLNSARQRERVEGFLERRPEHAEIVTGGKEPDLPGFFLEPTVVGGLRQDDEMIQREIFGPVITVQPFTDEAEAIAWANGTPYGLAVARSGRATSAARCGSAKALRFGCVWINDHIPFASRDAARRLQAVRLRQGPVGVLARGLHRGQARHGEPLASPASGAAARVWSRGGACPPAGGACCPPSAWSSCAGAGRAARPRSRCGEPLERELAVARLRARVLGHGGHARPEFRAYPRFLCLDRALRRARRRRPPRSARR